MTRPVPITRRRALGATGLLIVGFQLSGNRAGVAATTGSSALPGSLAGTPFLDSWIRIDATGTISVFTGKAELGQGIKTALLQIAAEELRVPVASLHLITADTARAPNEGYTAGSYSVQNSGGAIQIAAAQVREILIAEAARRLNVPYDDLRAENGTIISSAGQRLPYGALVRDDLVHVVAEPHAKLTTPSKFKVIGKSTPRVDIPAKVTGGSAYVHDMRLPGMWHARIVRPPSYGANLWRAIHKPSRNYQASRKSSATGISSPSWPMMSFAASRPCVPWRTPRSGRQPSAFLMRTICPTSSPHFPRRMW